MVHYPGVIKLKAKYGVPIDLSKVQHRQFGTGEAIGVYDDIVYIIARNHIRSKLIHTLAKPSYFLVAYPVATTSSPLLMCQRLFDGRTDVQDIEIKTVTALLFCARSYYSCDFSRPLGIKVSTDIELLTKRNPLWYMMPVVLKASSLQS